MTVKLRERKLAKGAIKFYLDIYSNGEREYEFLDIVIRNDDKKETKQEKKRLANMIRSTRELELISGGTNYIPTHLKKINFFDFAEAFIKDYSKKDIRMIQATLSQFRTYINNDKLRLIDISPTTMEGYKNYLNEHKSLNGETPHNYFTRFKKILKSAEIKGLLKENPTKNIRFQRSSNTRDNLAKNVLDSDELKELAKTHCGNDEVKKAFLFACFTGLGLAEIKKLTWKNITNERLITNREKTGRKVDIKLKDSLKALIGEPNGKDEPIFSLAIDGKFISDNAVNKTIKNWVNRAKIKKHITFYCARHTFATQLLIHGANLKTVADALGHSTTRETVKYLNYIDSLKDDAVDNLPDLF